MVSAGRCLRVTRTERMESFALFDFREKKLELRVAATGATDPEKEVAV